MEIWIAESPYERLGFHSKEKAKAQVMAWLVEEYEECADICGSTAILEEAVECLEKFGCFAMYDYDDEEYEWSWFELEMGE